ncbi:hypothetical protein [Natronorubrum sulfidifaciens]|uniref:Uncharacterized protein n=1 Tax=Natronorubrum sulfidifaciens JCM 14089 TaxID=1230460 RepID=L9WBE2_9EURY|nr:hypothetical protein [Natronorubrum sulfidifaciens]ELY46677.1 hypothetical protein C495_06203 [Natronorubrum sulfidifaciens JCM 14089]
MRRIAIYTIAEGKDTINARIEDAVEYISDELGHDFPHSKIREARRKHQQGHTVSQHESDDANLKIGIDMPPGDRIEDAEKPGSVADHPREDGHLITVTERDAPPAEPMRILMKRGVTVHVIDAGLRVKSGKTGGLSPAAKRAIEAIKDTNDAKTDPNEPLTGHVHKGGRPPVGCRVENGMLRADDNYSKVRQTLFRVENGEMSRAAAARRLECVPKTIDNALERRELYRLDAIEPVEA